MIDLPIGVQDGKKVVLDLVGMFDAGDLKGLSSLRDAENQMAPVRVGESRDRFEGRLGNGGASLLELDVFPLANLQQFA